MNKLQDAGGIKSFFMAMLPNFERKLLLDDLDSAFKEMVVTREMYSVMGRDYIDVMREEFPQLDKELNAHVKKYNGNIIVDLQNLMTARLKEKNDFTAFIEEIYGPLVIKDVMDYRKLHMLRYVA